ILGVGREDRMPLEEEPLSEKQTAVIRAWIAQGAEWPAGVGPDVARHRHWAFIKPVRPEVPQVKNAAWPRNPIDNFVLARLESEQLSPSPPAEPAKLLRRVYLDLIGLPPSVDEIAAFEADPSPAAFEKIVDRLLASDHYGERWARPWLDSARYADSNGYQADQYREVWPYRDWVIDAMNADMPFTQFTIEQLAGDLLPNADAWQKVATGFHRQTTCNVEAGVDPEENRVNQIIDRVNTTGAVWLGVTIGCVQCHNHPYDPFSQRDYYRLFAYFNNTPLEVKHTSATTFDFFGPKMNIEIAGKVSPAKQRLKDEYDAAVAERDALLDTLLAGQAEWERRELARLEAGDGQGNKSDGWQVVEVQEFASAGGASHKLLGDGSVLIGGAKPNVDTYTLLAKTKLSRITAVKLETLTDPSLPGEGPGRHDAERPNFVLNDFRIAIGAAGAKSDGFAPLKLHSAWADYSQPQYPVAGAIDDDPSKTGWAIHGEFHKPHVATFRTAAPAGHDGGTLLRIEMAQNHGEGRTIGRLRISVCEGEPPADESAPASPAARQIVDILKTPAESRDEERVDILREYYFAQTPRLAELGGAIESLKKKLGAELTATTLVMTETESRATNILTRGDFLQPREAVEAGVPASLHAAPDGAPNNRLGLAQWLASRDNPLTARVTVNRWWEQIFGRGIVRTLEDLGAQGDAPTHPELLDWLAVEFMDGGWKMKRMHKLIVTSATYQQDSRITPDLLKRDPHNELLARGPRVRMSAEMIRDNGLAASGLLSEKMGGPPVFPPQPDGVWRHVGRNAPKYATDTDEDRYRRGIYVIWRRSAPYASFVNFDAPDRADCVVKRSRTNTPLQALTLLNDEAYVEMAWALARRVLGEAKQMSDRDRAVWAFRTVLARRPRDAEVALLTSLYQQELSRLSKDAAAARL
ncbi:MAG: DUF1553 domain-containing protein, partial [Planctomycetales bacterium]|nr:DUF1553 domain-containing protein [Planctomycetales bacterium]